MDRKKIINNKIFVHFLFVIASSSLGVIQYFSGKYHIVDDSIMNYIARGGFSAKPDEHIVFINIIFGKVCKWLYLLNSSINWFGLVYILEMIIVVLLLYKILCAYANSWLAFLISIMTEIFIIKFFTFTTFGFLCTTIGIIGLIDAISTEANKRKRIVFLSTSIIVFLIGLLMREDAWKVAIIVNSLLIVVFLKRNFLIKKKIILLTFMILIVLSSTAISINYCVYHNEKNKEYTEYNISRSKVLDYPVASYKKRKKDYNRIGISINDYKCFKGKKGPRYLIGDKKVFSKNTLEQISNLSTKYKFNLKEWIASLLDYKQCWLLLIVAVLLLICDFGERRYYYLFESILVYLLTLIMFIIQRGLLRIYIAIMFAGVLNVLYYYFSNKLRIINRRRRIATFILIIPFTVFIGLQCSEIYIGYKNNELNKKNSYEVKCYINSNKESLYVMPSFKIDQCFFSQKIRNMAKEKYTNVLPSFDWYTYLNDYYNKMKSYKISNKDSLLTSMIEGNVYYISTNDLHDRQERKIIKKFIKEHSKHKSTMVKEIGKIGNSKYYVYKYLAKK